MIMRVKKVTLRGRVLWLWEWRKWCSEKGSHDYESEENDIFRLFLHIKYCEPQQNLVIACNAKRKQSNFTTRALLVKRAGNIYFTETVLTQNEAECIWSETFNFISFFSDAWFKYLIKITINALNRFIIYGDSIRPTGWGLTGWYSAQL